MHNERHCSIEVDKIICIELTNLLETYTSLRLCPNWKVQIEEGSLSPQQEQISSDDLSKGENEHLTLSIASIIVEHIETHQKQWPINPTSITLEIESLCELLTRKPDLIMGVTIKEKKSKECSIATTISLNFNARFFKMHSVILILTNSKAQFVWFHDFFHLAFLEYCVTLNYSLPFVTFRCHNVAASLFIDTLTNIFVNFSSSLTFQLNTKYTYEQSQADDACYLLAPRNMRS